jgi:osmotically-inducible protein OsmY
MTQGFAYNARSGLGLKLPWAKGASKTKRSEAAVGEEVSDALRHCPSLAQDAISVHALKGTVRLTGTVVSWENRRLAGEAAWSIEGVDDVINDLQVERL